MTNASTTIGTVSASADMVGNIAYVAGGTGSITGGWYQIVSQVTSTSITVDRSTGLTTGTGVTVNVGGALDGFVTLAGVMLTSNRAFIQASSGFTITASVTFGALAASPSNTVPWTRITGYTTTRGDSGRASITLATNANIGGLIFTNGGWYIENLAINGASLSNCHGLQPGGQFSYIRNVKISNTTNSAISFGSSNTFLFGCEITGCSNFTIFYSSSNNRVYNNWIHDNTCIGLSIGGAQDSVHDNLITNNTGATSDGIFLNNMDLVSVSNNVIFGNGRHGINSGATSFLESTIVGNILASNGGYGIQLQTSAGLPADPAYDGNAYYNNTSGTRHFMDDTGSVNPINAVAPYTNVLDIILSANPFVASGSNDYRLNTTAGGGAACRGFGVPQSWPGNSLTTSFPDMGAAQHQDGLPASASSCSSP